MLNLDWATIAFEILNFLVLSVLLYRFLFQPVMRNVRERAAEKERLMGEMKQEQQEATRLRSELESRLAQADEEATAILDKAEKRAEVERTELLREAQAEAERILVEAHVAAAKWQQQAVSEFHEELLDVILDMSGQVIGRSAPPELHDTLVQQLGDRIWELGRGEMRRVEMIRRSLEDRVPTVHVTSARPLSPEQQGLLIQTFTALADRSVNLELETDAGLTAGLRVRLGDVVMDNSIAGQLADLREGVADLLKKQAAPKE
jgi:F-type H+-transporting ATPase subunit b